MLQREFANFDGAFRLAATGRGHAWLYVLRPFQFWEGGFTSGECEISHVREVAYTNGAEVAQLVEAIAITSLYDVTSKALLFHPNFHFSLITHFRGKDLKVLKIAFRARIFASEIFKDPFYVLWRPSGSSADFQFLLPIDVGTRLNNNNLVFTFQQQI